MKNCSECKYYEDDPPWCGFYENPLEKDDTQAEYCIPGEPKDG
ncbi:MAG: hypothetical protein ABSG22_10705 [Sedimentisphaerales bacterium]